MILMCQGIFTPQLVQWVECQIFHSIKRLFFIYKMYVCQIQTYHCENAWSNSDKSLRLQSPAAELTSAVHSYTHHCISSIVEPLMKDTLRRE